MKLGLLFVLIAAPFGIFSLSFTPWTLPLLWPCLSLVLVGAAHMGLGVSVFGKAPDGALARWSKVLMLPYLLYLRVLEHTLRVLRPEDPFNELAPGIYIGRRLCITELPSDISLVVDLTCEFDESEAVRSLGLYRSLPTLDSSIPSLRGALSLVGELEAHNGRLYMHCARGHGRTGTMAAILLLAKGLEAHPKAAIKMVQSVRPRARLNHAQRRFVVRAHEAMSALS